MTTHGQRINELEVGSSVVLEKVLPTGSLEARRLRSGGVQFYWRATSEGKTERLPIGPYDSSASPKSLKPTNRGYSVQAAIEKARSLSMQNAETPGGLRAAEQRRKAEAAAAARAETIRSKYTLKALCADYVSWLKGRGKSSWREAQTVFKNHLEVADPELAAKVAREVEQREVVALVRRLTEAGKAPTGRKLRAYLRAAYACATRAASDAALPSSFIGYEVEVNPVESTAAIKGTADKNPLTGEELRRYWKALQDIEGVIGAALRLQVISGGQRVVQLARLPAAEASGDVLKLLDPKGKRSEAREHLLPVTKAMRRELDQLAKQGYLLSTDGGKTAMHPTSVSAWAAEVAAGAKIEAFQLKRVRSGIETLLAEAGVSREIRGQLQSHGIGGVQERHYDAHRYLPEKKHALEALHRLLEQQPAKNVTLISKRKRA